MIENDKIVFAELASLLVSGRQLDMEQEKVLENLLIRYPSARTYLLSIVEKGTIESSLDLRKIDIEVEWEKFQTINVHHSKRKIISKIGTKNLLKIVACLFFAAFLSLLIYTRNSSPKYIVADTVFGQKNDILPAEEVALFEVDGRSVENLDQITREVVGNNPKNNLKCRVVTPARAYYNVVLSDGTKVWLSPESEFTYTSLFSTHERRVHLKGEAYFDIAKDKERPFIVDVNGMEIKALGTEFAVNTLKEGKPKVILTEGALSIKNNKDKTTINAGYQASLVNGTLKSELAEDLDGALSIKNGLLSFNNKDLETILDDIRRWYGVEVEIERKLDPKKYAGDIQRNVTLAKLCAVLKDLTGYLYVIDGKKLIIK